MTDSRPTLIRDDLAFVRQASRPGSLEARYVHHCTCVEDLDRGRTWNPDDVASWQADIDLACPAHGRLLEAYIASVNATLGRSEAEREAVFERAYVDHVIGRATRPRPRSLLAQLRDAWRGALAGWRGV